MTKPDQRTLRLTPLAAAIFACFSVFAPHAAQAETPISIAVGLDGTSRPDSLRFKIPTDANSTISDLVLLGANGQRTSLKNLFRFERQADGNTLATFTDPMDFDALLGSSLSLEIIKDTPSGPVTQTLTFNAKVDTYSDSVLKDAILYFLGLPGATIAQAAATLKWYGVAPEQIDRIFQDLPAFAAGTSSTYYSQAPIPYDWWTYYTNPQALSDTPPQISALTLVATDSGITAICTITDPDGVRNTTFNLYGGSGSLIASSPTGGFGGLSAETAYRVEMVAEYFNRFTNTWVPVRVAAQTTTSAAVITQPPPAPADTTPPVTTAGPSVSGTTHAATALSVTINENGTGYYLVQAAAAAAPSVAAVQAGTSFAMTANVPATPAISGLTASTAYKIYFVAKDAANNVQAAVQSVAVSTTAAPDVTAPTTTAGPSVSGTTDTATTLSVTINENGTGYYLVQAAAAAAPSVAAVQAGTSFAMTANVPATPAISGLTASTAYKIYFVAKDAANNVQAAVQSVAVTTTAAPDVTPPTTTAGPSVSGTTDTATTLSVTINENGTGYYLVQAAAAAPPSVAAVQAGTSFAMTANVAATPALSGLTASTAYKIYFVAKDAANNVQAAVQSVAVTTIADVTPPAAPTGLALNAGAVSTTVTNVTLDGLTTPADPDLAAWFVSESGSAPAAGAAGWSSTKPTSYTFATATNETKTVCVYVKDTAGNVQPVGACDTIDKVP